MFREVTIGDAEFILSLRLNEKNRKWLSKTPTLVEDQIDYIKNYKLSNDQAYFIICKRSGTPIGCLRIYEPHGDTYCWGSWVTVIGLSPVVALESALLLYAYAKALGFKSARIEVRKENISVWKFHERAFGAIRVGETELDFLYVVTSEKIEAALARSASLVPNPLVIEPLFN